jgi:hypothetical protein
VTKPASSSFLISEEDKKQKRKIFHIPGGTNYFLFGTGDVTRQEPVYYPRNSVLEFYNNLWG